MDTCSVALTFESVDEFLLHDHLNEMSLAILLHCIIILFINILQN